MSDCKIVKIIHGANGTRLLTIPKSIRGDFGTRYMSVRHDSDGRLIYTPVGELQDGDGENGDGDEN